MGQKNNELWGTAKLRRTFAVACALVAILAGRNAQATTITVNVNGAPQSGKCNLTDAVQAATTNLAVHSCPAGSSSSTDTIVLAANTMYQGYGKALNFPSTGGAVVLQGTKSSGVANTIIRAPNYGYPTPAGGTSACPFPAAIYSGGTLTIKDLLLQSSITGTNGVCQHAGSLTVDNGYIGDTADSGFGFNARGIASFPSGANNHRSITIKNFSQVVNNYSPNAGGGLAAIGDVTITLTNALFGGNASAESGGGIYLAGGWGKMGNLTSTGTNFYYNEAGIEGGWGGALYLGGDDAAATVSITGSDIQQNVVDTWTGGAIFVGSGMGSGKVTIASSFFAGNLSFFDLQQNTLNSDASTYTAVRCNSSSTMPDLTGSEWTGHSPPLQGDGTCSFP
jgi:hypothetical protein